MSRPTDHNCILQARPDSPPFRVHIDALKPFKGDTPEEWLQVTEPPSESPQTNKEVEEGGNGVPANLSSSPDGEEDEQKEDESDNGEDEEQEDNDEGEIEANEETVEAPQESLRRGGRVRKPPVRLDW